MKVMFSDGARADMKWFDEYFTEHLPGGKEKAYLSFESTLKLILAFPDIGELDVVVGTRELLITKTRFTFIFKVRGEVLEILNIWDTRRDRRDR